MDQDATYTSIRNITLQLMAEVRKPTMHDFPLYLLYAIEGYKEYRKDYGWDVETVRLQPRADGTCPLPRGYLQWTKIGVQYGNRVEALLHDSTLAMKRGNTYSKDEKYADIRVPFMNYWGQVNGNYGLHELEGFCESRYEARNGYFKVDKKCGQIILDMRSNAVDKPIYLEYITKAVKPHTRTMVPEEAATVIKAFAYWREAFYMKGAATSETYARKQDFLDELDLMKKRLSDVTIDNIIQSYRKFTYYGIK